MCVCGGRAAAESPRGEQSYPGSPGLLVLGDANYENNESLQWCGYAENILQYEASTTETECSGHPRDAQQCNNSHSSSNLTDVGKY